MRAIFILAVALSALPAAAADSIQPVLLRGDSLHGGVFTDPRTVKGEETSEAGKTATLDLVAHESADGCLQTGVYETAGPNKYTSTEPYPHDEFMWFLKGGVSLHSSDGKTTTVAAGDGVLIPKGWTGVWDSPGYRKIYVIYDCKHP